MLANLPSASLHRRLLLGTLLTMSLALTLAGFGLAKIFQHQISQQLEQSLVVQLDQLSNALAFDALGQATVRVPAGADPRWETPYSGLYWQLDSIDDQAKLRPVVRSRSLWDTSLEWADGRVFDGTVHAHRIGGPNGQALLLVERTLRSPESPQIAWRLVVAADIASLENAGKQFNQLLAVCLLLFLAILLLAALAQVAVGLRPLRSLGLALQNLDEGRTSRLEGAFPSEVQAMVDRLNKLNERNQELVQRARTQTGNLAHAMKTPLAVLEQAANREILLNQGKFPALVKAQIASAQDQIEWQLARARASSLQALPGQFTLVQAPLTGMLRLMEKVHADKQLALQLTIDSPTLAFAGSEHDFHELVGNLLDNACKWARSQVWVSANAKLDAGQRHLVVMVEDDGPGIAPARYAEVLARGVRLDESVPGSGLGLGIVAELSASQGGQLTLGRSTHGGLCASLTLPIGTA